MQISLDIRWHDETTPYGKFVLHLLWSLLQWESETKYIVYTHQTSSVELPSNIQIRHSSRKKGKFFHDISFKKQLNSDTSHLYIFFDEHVPYGFKKDYIVLIPSLTEVFFPSHWGLRNILYQRKLSYAIHHASQILCLDKNTSRELNERLNIPESKIWIISGFFPDTSVSIPKTDLKIDIEVKHGLDAPYFLYDVENTNSSNFERVLKIFQNISKSDTPAHLLVISEAIAKEVQLRQKALDMWIQKQVLFIWEVDPSEQYYYYTQSSWVIFPSIYGSFPFDFQRAIAHKTPIIASDLKSTVSVMGESISYFNSRSTSEATDQIHDFLKKNTPTGTSYIDLHTKLNLTHTTAALKKHITNWEENPWK